MSPATHVNTMLRTCSRCEAKQSPTRRCEISSRPGWQLNLPKKDTESAFLRSMQLNVSIDIDVASPPAITRIRQPPRSTLIPYTTLFRALEKLKHKTRLKP